MQLLAPCRIARLEHVAHQAAKDILFSKAYNAEIELTVKYTADPAIAMLQVIYRRNSAILVQGEDILRTDSDDLPQIVTDSFETMEKIWTAMGIHGGRKVIPYHVKYHLERQRREPVFYSPEQCGIILQKAGLVKNPLFLPRRPRYTLQEIADILQMTHEFAEDKAQKAAYDGALNLVINN
ncbi:MAG TPA: hypothetical protein VFF28_05785 [Candidatus Nanoarchaeia archaeon]|nr:hypothetical protein [Candidatus Nanoarchaeia archaeon]